MSVTPCYVMSDDLYSKYGCSCGDLSGNGDTDGCIGTNENGIVVSVIHSTAYGDGDYDGYFVDSGQIGIVNGDFCKEDSGEYFYKVPSGKAKVSLTYEEGLFDITVVDSETGKNLFNEYIDTSYEEEDEDYSEGEEEDDFFEEDDSEDVD